jgi:heat shock protein HtpX
MIRSINNFKTVLLLGALMGLCMVVGSAFGRQGLLIGFLVGGGMNLFAFFFSDKIAIASMKGRELTPETGGDLYRMVDALRQRAGLPMPKVYLCPHEAPNAFATGRSPNKSAVAFTQGLINVMSPGELEGVIAHELAHIKNRDTLTSTIAATIAGALSFVAQWGFFLSPGSNSERPHPFIGIIAMLLAPIGAAIIKGAISRSREFVADHDAAQMVGSPDGLISALRKLDTLAQRIPLRQPNPAMNNLFIIEPMMGRGLNNLFATHPPTTKRIAALQTLQAESGQPSLMPHERALEWTTTDAHPPASLQPRRWSRF